MPGGGWAAVATWVRNAEQGNNGLKFVSAEDARPGDIVAYDWGGQNDFGSDGHIGFLDSTVKDGKFTALEGNNADAVTSRPAPVRRRRERRVHPRRGRRAGRRAPVAAAGRRRARGARASHPIDPSQFGGEGTGTGGPPSAEALALLNNKNIVLDSVGIADIKAGRIDPRVIGVLTKLSPSTRSRSRACARTTRSSPRAARSPTTSSAAARTSRRSTARSSAPAARSRARWPASSPRSNPDIRPNEIGSPFAINGPGYFTDAAHQNHLHIGFKQEIPADWKPPADVARGAGPPRRAGRRAGRGRRRGPGAPRGRAAPEVRKGSQTFLKAVTAQAAEADRKRGAGNDSLAFLKAVEPPKASAAAAPGRRRGRPPPPRRPGRRRGRPPPAAAGAAVDAAAVAAAAPDAYPGDDAPREQIAAWMAGQAQKRGLPPQLPLMASLVESGMKNLNFGDADSVGFFQMRVGIWNQGAYAGYPEKPELQVKWFLDQAEAVKRQRLVSGKSITDPNQFGDWIADVERPAAQYRGRYQTKLDEANGLLGSAAHAGRRTRPGRRAGRSRRGRRERRRGRRREAARRDPRAGRRRRSPPATRPGRRRSRRSRRPRSTSAPTTSGAARRRRPASTAPA